MQNILINPGEYSFVEKYSKFIGQSRQVGTEDEARAFLDDVRGKHATASHHAYAYMILSGNKIRISDAGEPQGTAGLPIHKVFQGKDIVDYICVVTRYFGGILLGTGGLTRAYAKAAKGALAASGFARRITYRYFDVICEYKHLERIRHSFDGWGVEVVSTDYSECCIMRVRMTDDSAEPFLCGGLYEYVEVIRS